MTPEPYSLTVTSDVINLETITKFVTKAARQAGLDEQSIFGVQMAVDEACTNIIEHAYASASGDLHLTCQAESGEFIITIRDHGRTFDPESISPPDINAPLEERQVGGLGLYLMRELMDQVRFSSDSEGNQLVMIKNIPQDEPEADEKIVVVNTRGRIDAAQAPLLETRLKDLLTQGETKIVVNMADVPYISSSGLKVLLTALRRARRQQGDLVLCNLQPKVSSIMEMIGFDLVFPIAHNLETAPDLFK